jgi:hypothetical protein
MAMIAEKKPPQVTQVAEIAVLNLAPAVSGPVGGGHGER